MFTQTHKCLFRQEHLEQRPWRRFILQQHIVRPGAFSWNNTPLCVVFWCIQRASTAHQTMP